MGRLELEGLGVLGLKKAKIRETGEVGDGGGLETEVESQKGVLRWLERVQGGVPEEIY